MTENEQKQVLFLSALKEVARQYPRYFSNSENLENITSIWDLQPCYSMMEHLLLEEDSVKHFIFVVWSFFKPVAFEKMGLAEMIRPLEHWHRELLVELILNDSIQ